MTDAPRTTKIVIDPVTRIEGHGKVTIRLDADGNVGEARFHVVEFRGFERFIVGRPYWQAAVTVQRLCGICPVSHHLCAGKAADKIAGVDALSPPAEKLRRLLHYAQVLQSHAVHFFHLASPDLLFGFDAPAERRNIAAIVAEQPEIAKWAILIRKFGQETIKALGGKKVHPVFVVPGGVNASLAAADRARLRAGIGEIVGWSMDALALCKRVIAAGGARVAGFGSFPSNYVSIVGAGGGLDLYDGRLRAIAPDGATIFDGVEPEAYREYIAEDVRPWSYMKFPRIRMLERERAWYRVGPLAQLNCCDGIGTPLADAERDAFLAAGGGRPVHATLYQHWARLIVMVHCAETIERLLADDDLESSDLVRAGTRRASGIAWLEAPRGTLIHRYAVGDDDLIAEADLIVATTNNNEAINRSVQAVAVAELGGREITEGLLNGIEVAVRAYDPCLSCATHAIGEMPLVVTLEDADGAVLEQRVR